MTPAIASASATINGLRKRTPTRSVKRAMTLKVPRREALPKRSGGLIAPDRNPDATEQILHDVGPALSAQRRLGPDDDPVAEDRGREFLEERLHRGRVGGDRRLRPFVVADPLQGEGRAGWQLERVGQ